MKRYYSMRPSLQLLQDKPEVDKVGIRKNNNHIMVTMAEIMPDAEVQATSLRIGRESSKVEVESLALMMRSTNEAISNVRVLLSNMKGLTVDDVAGTNEKAGITYDIMSEEEDEKDENVTIVDMEQPTRTINVREDGPDVESIEGLVTPGVSSEFIDEKGNKNDKLISTRTEIGKEGLDVVCPEDVVTFSRESDDKTENVVIADEPTCTTAESETDVYDIEISEDVIPSNVIVESQDEKENIVTEPACTRTEIVKERLVVVVTSNVSGAESEDEKENLCTQSTPISKSNLQPLIPNVKLEPSAVRDRIKAVDNVRILVQHEQTKGESSRYLP